MFRLGFHDSESVAYLFLMDLQNVELALKPILRGDLPKIRFEPASRVSRSLSPRSTSAGSTFVLNRSVLHNTLVRPLLANRRPVTQ